MPIGHGPTRYAIVRTLAFALDCITPLSILHTLYLTATHFYQTHRFADTKPTYTYWSSWLLPLWFTLETSFFVWMLHMRRKAQQVPTIEPMDKETRQMIFTRILQNITPDRGRIFVASQFLWKKTGQQLRPDDIKDIKLGNLRDWVSWAAFAKPTAGDVLNSPNGEENIAEVNNMLKQMQKKFHVQLEEGYNPDVLGVTIYFNKVEAFSKPLLFYAGVGLLERSAHMVLRLAGFERFRAKRKDICLDMPDRTITYWLRSPKRIPKSASKTKHSDAASPTMSRRKRPQDDLPVVFIHGLGGGLWCYLKFILKLWWQSSHRPIFLIELPHVSMRLTSAAPSLDQFTHEVSAMLRRHYYDAATFVAHSLGTAYVSYLIQKTKKVAGCVMMDPICFKTYDAGLLYNFVWRRPTRANEFLVWWLVARELFISQWISRQFIWYKAHLVPSLLPCPQTPSDTLEMPPQPTPAPNPLCHIYVSSDDNIIDAPTVSTYLTSNKVEHTVLEGYDHAQFLLSESVEWGIIERIESVCEEARRECGRRVEKGRRRRRYKR